MAGKSAILKVEIIADASKAKAGLRQAEAGVEGFGNKVKGTGQKFHGMATAMAGAFAAVGAAKIFGDSIGEAREAAKTMAQTNAVIKSTGQAAGVTADHVANLAGSLSNMAGVDDEAIQGAENLLLTFTNIKGTNFDAATEAVLNMNQALGKGPEGLAGTATLVGKALNDPVKGLAALSKNGIQFTDAQKDMIKNMVKAGDTAGAQKLILKELGTEFGGAAKAVADPFDKLNVSIGNAKESLGTALLPALSGAADAMAKFFTFLSENQGAMTAFLAIVAALTLAWIAYSVATALAATGMFALTWPILLIVVGIAALIAVIIVLVIRFKFLRDAAVAVWNAIWAAGRAVVNWFRSAWSSTISWFTSLFRTIGNVATSVWSTVTGAARSAVSTVKSIWSDIVGFFSDIASGIARAVSGLFDKITEPFRRAMSWIRSNFHLPKIDLNPFKAAMASAPGAMATTGPPVLTRGRGAVVAAPTASIAVNVRVDPTASPTQVGAAIVGALKAYYRGNGRPPSGAFA